MAKKAFTIAALYMLFASFSTLINIGSQMVSMWVYKESYAVEISILVGTVSALPLRYVLEKRYIFSFKSHNIKTDGQLFLLYSLMGIFTTAIFWVTEYAFHLILADESMRYLGGVIGLVIGFYVKYRLDKKYVFVNGNQRVTA
jgi:putative flippase GtrA